MTRPTGGYKLATRPMTSLAERSRRPRPRLPPAPKRRAQAKTAKKAARTASAATPKNPALAKPSRTKITPAPQHNLGAKPMAVAKPKPAGQARPS